MAMTTMAVFTTTRPEKSLKKCLYIARSETCHEKWIDFDFLMPTKERLDALAEQTEKEAQEQEQRDNEQSWIESRAPVEELDDQPPGTYLDTEGIYERNSPMSLNFRGIPTSQSFGFVGGRSIASGLANSITNQTHQALGIQQQLQRQRDFELSLASMRESSRQRPYQEEEIAARIKRRARLRRAGIPQPLGQSRPTGSRRFFRKEG